MKSFFRYVLISVVSLVFICSSIGLFNRGRGFISKFKSKNEYFDPRLTHINSVNKLIVYSDSLYRLNSPDGFDTSAYVNTLSDLIKWRFRKGLATYNFQNNWIAFTMGKYLWAHFSAIVKPDDILQYNEGLCSQQTMVFMEALKRKGIDYRSVGLGFDEGPGHFLCEVRYEGAWHLYDVTLEPQWQNVALQNRSIDYYKTNVNDLYLAYESRISKDVIDKLMQRIVYGDVNKFPAANMLLIHKITFLLIWILPFISGYLLIRLLRRPKAINQTI